MCSLLNSLLTSSCIFIFYFKSLMIAIDDGFSNRNEDSKNIVVDVTFQCPSMKFRRKEHKKKKAKKLRKEDIKERAIIKVCYTKTVVQIHSYIIVRENRMEHLRLFNIHTFSKMKQNKRSKEIKINQNCIRAT